MVLELAAAEPAGPQVAVSREALKAAEAVAVREGVVPVARQVGRVVVRRVGPVATVRGPSVRAGQSES